MTARLSDSRFMELVSPEPNTGCWLWLGPDSHGYGTFGGRGTRPSNLAHRIAYERFVGPIPVGLFVCHRCDVKCCVNPDHLFLGTNQDNILDASRKGLLVGNHFRDKTHCIRGHAFDDANTLRCRHGHRHCIECKRQTRREWRARRVAAGLLPS